MKTYTKVHDTKLIAKNHISAIKKRGGKAKQYEKNGKIVVEYSFPSK